MYECLFEENQIGTMKLKNRLIVPAMSTRFVGEDGRATEQFTAYHETRAKGGWALIITEDFLIDEGVGIKKELPGLWDDGQIEGYKKCTDRIHAAGGKICAQIYHAGRNTHSGITGIHNVGPSPICDPSNREVPHELTAGEIKAIEEKFADAALRARKAGFDAVELHGAHGYLIAQFLSPFSNRRTDGYGGTLENRARFAVETVKAVKEKAGWDYPVLFRISATEFIDQGMNVEQAKAICRLVEQAGADAINCSQSGPATFYNTVPSFYVPNGAFVELANEIRKVVGIPVATVGRINSPQLAEEVILSGKADLVAMGRASVADPDLPLKLQSGDTHLHRMLPGMSWKHVKEKDAYLPCESLRRQGDHTFAKGQGRTCQEDSGCRRRHQRLRGRHCGCHAGPSSNPGGAGREAWGTVDCGRHAMQQGGFFFLCKLAEAYA